MCVFFFWCVAFDKAVISDPSFEAVIHTASPYHFNAKDVKRELLDPGEWIWFFWIHMGCGR